MTRETIGAKTKRSCKNVWDVLAAEYYSSRHKTSRNFDAIIRFYLPKLVPKLYSKGLYLDLGGGKGKLQEIYPNLRLKVVIGDFSVPMLKANHVKFKGAFAVQMDAFNIPFAENTFDAVFSLLGDHYALKRAFYEAHRVLKPNGFFLLTLPAKIWRQSITTSVGIKENETVFILSNGVQRKVPSFLYSPSELTHVLMDAGFKLVRSDDWNSCSLVEKSNFSDHVIIAARNLGISPEEVPLITWALAWKTRSAVE
jgi:SAM-dependent methyltransferase